MNDIVLGGAASTQQSTGKNSSSGGGVGVSIGGGTNGYGISVFANVNASRGSEKGNGTAWNETTLDSGGTVSMTSGRDAILDGAQVSGDKIIADIGRDLRMRSQQDSNDFKSKQTSVAAGGSFTFGSMTGSGYISASQDRMKSTYDSVQEQTGLFAGQGGFDVTVGRHTQLDGAVIASAATAEKNSLDTGTLGFSDIGNAADYKVSHTGISLSGGSSFGSTSGGSMAGGAPAMAASSGHAEGITRAAIGAGTITVRDQDKQQQNIAGLSRDTDNANGSIGPIFDREKEQKRLAAVGLVIEIGSQVSDIAKKQGELNGLKKAREAHPEMTAEQLKDTPEYKTVMAEYGTGSNLQRGIQAATAALQGLAGGNIAGGLAAAAAPELANVLKSTEDKPEVNILAHAILGGAVAAMQGNSVAAGAAGAGVGELAAHGIMATLYPGKEASDLGEDDRQLISTLATISAGMAGGLAGNGTSSAAAGAQAGRNAVENNALSFGSGMDSYVNAAASWNQYAAANGLTSEETQAGLDKLAKGDLPDGANITKAIVDGYQDGVMIAGAWYLGPAASVGKVVAGGAIAEGANGYFQWENLNKPGNENESWNYRSSAAAFASGMLAPGRYIPANIAIGMGGAWFSDGLNGASQAGAALGGLAGGAFGTFAPMGVGKIIGKDLPGFAYDIGGAYIFEYGNDATKDLIKKFGDN